MSLCPLLLKLTCRFQRHFEDTFVLLQILQDLNGLLLIHAEHKLLLCKSKKNRHITSSDQKAVGECVVYYIKGLYMA